jgi:hypothetical protein
MAYRTPFSTRGDANYGDYLNSYQLINGARHQWDPTVNYVNYGFGRVPIGETQGRDVNGLLDQSVTPAPTPPQFKFTFDTIGQVIFRSIGHCRLPLRTLWALGINESGDVSISNTQTFAAAICAPIDPLEEGEIFAIWDGGSQTFNSSGVITPAGWTPEDAALLATSLANVVIFPGDEAQLPASLIVADKGADKTNAFRGIRYLIFPDYPINGGGRGGGLPQLSVGWQRTNDEPPNAEFGGVEFLPGAT